MTTTAKTPTQRRTHIGIGQTVRNTGVLVRRNVLRNLRLPQLVLFATVQPVMFLLLFNFVFGGAIGAAVPVPGFEYIDWLLPGILVQTAVFGSTATALGLTEDLQAGVIDRFRSLPIARSAVLSGRTLADLLRSTFVALLMLFVGYLLGFRIGTDLGSALLGLVLALLFGFSMSWLAASIGLGVKNPEAAQSALFLLIFPFVFASSVFVPTGTMPDWLQVFADHQPVTILANAVRGLMVTGDVGTYGWRALLWIAAILVVFFPLTVRQYRRVVG
jgi:ABC-2 type transport system permease protein/oleandomycin transport system permease protein